MSFLVDSAVGFTFTMDYGTGVMSLVFGMLCLIQVMDAQSNFPIPCPPAFPDFETIFSRTLQLNRNLRGIKHTLQIQLHRPPNCSCSPALMSTIPDLNNQRCSRTSAIPRLCPTTSTAPTTSPTRPPTFEPEKTSSSRPIPPSPTDPPYTTNDGSRGPTSPSGEKYKSTSSMDDVNVIDLGRTDFPPKSTGLPKDPSPESVTTREQGFTIIVIAIGAGVLLLIFLIGCLLLCRKRLCVGSGVRGAHLKREKVRRLRSDCQPISAISRADTFEESYAPSMISSVGSIGSEGYQKSYVTNGRKWRPEFDSETGSEKSTTDSKYILLREDSSASALSFSNHYNTLRTIDHPHALMMGGFGESSTDVMTIPRTSKKKKRIANGDISLDSIEDPMEVMPNSSAMRRKHSKDSLNSIEIYDRVTSPRPRSMGMNGYANGHAPLPSSHCDNADESDSCSLGTIDQAEAVLDDPQIPIATAAPQPQQQPTAQAPMKRGIINLSFQPEDPAEKVEPTWQNNVLDELKRESEPEKYDSLLSVTNAHLFGSSESHIDPPSDFRDSKDSEISVAIVQPLKHDFQRFSRGFSKRKSDPPQASTSSPTKKEPPPVAKKPQNGSVKNGLMQQSSTDPVTNAPVDAIGQKDKIPVEPVTGAPMVNGIKSNGHLPVVNGIGSDDDDVGKVKKLIQQREAYLKPSAHVPPTRYGDTRL